MAVEADVLHLISFVFGAISISLRFYSCQDCTLILTEGDSAKTLAVSGLGVVGRDRYGVFPLKGKLLNVREATPSQVLKNEEIQVGARCRGASVGFVCVCVCVLLLRDAGVNDSCEVKKVAGRHGACGADFCQ